MQESIQCIAITWLQLDRYLKSYLFSSKN